MTTIRRLDTTRALLDAPPPTQVLGQLPLDPWWPDGTFGGPRPTTNWTPEQQAAHRTQLETALRNPTT